MSPQELMNHAVAMKFAIDMSSAQLAAVSDEGLAAAVSKAATAAKYNVPRAGEALDILRREQSRRGGGAGTANNNTKLYLLGGLGLAAGWFLFIRK